MKIVVLGGAGQMSAITVKDLAQSPDVKEVIVADVNFEKARKIAKENGPKCRAVYCDVSDHDNLLEVIKGADCVCNGCTYKVNLDVMRGCLAAGVHYTDLGGLYHMTKKQMELDEEFKKAGLTAVISMGGTPGTINVLARYAVDRMDTVETVRCLNGCGDWTKTTEVFSVPYSIKTIMEEFTTNPYEFLDGKHVAVEPRSGVELIDFPKPLGPAYANYTIHSEPATMPVVWKDKGIKNVEFKLALDPDFRDKVCFLADIGFASFEEIEIKEGVKASPAEMLDAVLKRLPKDPNAEVKDCDILRAEVIGKKDGKTIIYTVDSIARESKLYNCSSTELNTGVPPSIVAQMIVKGEITERGALPPEKAVPPEKYFEELAKREMYVYARVETPLHIQDWTPINAQKEI